MFKNHDVIDVDEYSKLEGFLKRFKLKQDEFAIYRVLSIEALPSYHGMQFVEYVITLMVFEKQYKLNIITSPNENKNFTRKLTIEPINILSNDELTSCINYLQRKRDVLQASKQLLEYGKLERQRNELGKYLLRELPDCLTISYKPNIGYHLKCHNEDITVLYFDSKWKIWWNCRNFTFFDYIDFNVDTETEFYVRSIVSMKSLTKPSKDFEVKKMHWADIIQNVRKAAVSTSRPPNNNSSRESIFTPIVEIDIASDDSDNIVDISGADSSDMIE